MLGYLPPHGNNTITTEHNSFSNELNNLSNVTISTSLVGGMTENAGAHSPNNNTMISSQILGSTPLSQIGCTLPIDHYASR